MEETPRSRLFALCWRGDQPRDWLYKLCEFIMYVGEIEGFEGCLEEIKELIESKKVKVNAVDENNVTALRFAAQFDHLDIVQYLLSKGASTKIKAKDGRDPLLSAVEKRNVEVVRALLNAGAGTKCSRGEQGRKEKIWPLSQARENSHKEMEELLLEFGATDPKPLSDKCNLM